VQALNNKDLKKYLKEKSQENTPDLWDQIEKKLENKDRELKVIKVRKKNNKKYVQVILAAAIILVIVGVKIDPEVKLVGEEQVIKNKDQSREPVLYSSLNFGAAVTGDSILNYGIAKDFQDAKDTSESCLESFSEDILKDMNIMCKVTVVNTYLKDYNYVVKEDKFRPEGELISQTEQSKIYDVRVDKIYYSDGDIKEGDIIKLEQHNFLGSSIGALSSELSIEHEYILPLSKLENSTLLGITNYVEGNINLEGQYGIVYPFINQIEVTRNNEYIFHGGWKSLIDENTVDVILDSKKDNTEDVFYMNQIKLRRDKGFEDDLISLIDKYKNK
jgi:hypothetical protein